jgi:hypothetical protein
MEVSEVMKKLLSVILMLAMLVAFSAIALADDTRVWQDGFGFHCNNASGNGATSVEYTGDDLAIQNSIGKIKKQPAGSMVVQKGDQKDIFGTKTFPITLDRVGTTTTWNLLTEDIVCETCGRNDWVTYSNNNGVINGKNIQANHPALPEEPVVDLAGMITLEKTIDGLSVMAWAEGEGLTEDIENIFADISFKIYKVANKGDDIATGEFIQNTEFFDINFDGQGTISFNEIDSSLLPGWFAVEEIIGETAADYFEDPGIQYFYFDVNGTAIGGKTGSVSIVSGVDGLIMDTKPELVGHPTDRPGYSTDNIVAYWMEYMDYDFGDAQFIWDTVNTHIYGVDGAVIEVNITVDVPGEVTSAWLDFGCDNAAVVYVNGRLAGYTASLQLPPADDENDFVDEGFGDLLFNVFDGRMDAWKQVQSINFEDLLNEGTNEITIYAANSASTGWLDGDTFMRVETGMDNDSYNMLNNPCGLIFNGAIEYEGDPTAFNNIPNIPVFEFSSMGSFSKVKYGGKVPFEPGEVFEFELFKMDANGEYTINVGTYETDLSGVVSFKVDEPGNYVFKEVLKVAHDIDPSPNKDDTWNYRLVWKAIYPDDKDGLYFDINANGILTWDVEDPDGPIVNNVYYCKHALQWLRYSEGVTRPEWDGGFLLYGGCGRQEYTIRNETLPGCTQEHRVQFGCPFELNNVWGLTIGPALGHDRDVVHTPASCTNAESYRFPCRRNPNCGNEKDNPVLLLEFVDGYDPDVGLAPKTGHDFDFEYGNRRNEKVSETGLYTASLWCKNDCAPGNGSWFANAISQQLECGDQYGRYDNLQPWICLQPDCVNCNPPDDTPDDTPEVCLVCSLEECTCPPELDNPDELPEEPE